MQPRLLHEPLRLAGASLLRLQSDARLVALARDGHAPAFATIVDRHRGALVRYCARLLGQARAEDAVQQALLNAHAAMHDTDRDIDLRPWLYRIAHNVSLNMLRGARETDVLSGERADPVDLEEVVAQREHLRATLGAINALPEPQRDALLLREIEGRSHEEIAAALGVTVGGARQHLHRARVALRTAMTAVTPYPLLVRLMSLAAPSGAESGAARAGEVAVGAGLGAVMTKVGVGALAAGALVGGALHGNHRHGQRAHTPHVSVSGTARRSSSAGGPPPAPAATGAGSGAHLATAPRAATADPQAGHAHHHVKQSSGHHDGSSGSPSASHGSDGGRGPGSGLGSGDGSHSGSDGGSSGGPSGSTGHSGDGSSGSGDHSSGQDSSGTGSSGTGSSGTGSSGTGSSGTGSSGTGSSGTGDAGSGSGDSQAQSTTTGDPAPNSGGNTGDGGASSTSGSSGGGDQSGGGDSTAGSSSTTSPQDGSGDGTSGRG